MTDKEKTVREVFDEIDEHVKTSVYYVIGEVDSLLDNDVIKNRLRRLSTQELKVVEFLVKETVRLAFDGI